MKYIPFHFNSILHFERFASYYETIFHLSENIRRPSMPLPEDARPLSIPNCQAPVSPLDRSPSHRYRYLNIFISVFLMSLMSNMFNGSNSNRIQPIFLLSGTHSPPLPGGDLVLPVGRQLEKNCQQNFVFRFLGKSVTLRILMANEIRY